MKEGRIGIFGGTFNPIHRGHLRAAYAFLEQAELAHLYVIPSGTPPHKALPENDPASRLVMTRLALAADSRFDGRASVSDIEIARGGASYSVLTVEAFRAAGMTDLFLYCGTDMLLCLDKWYRAETLLRDVTIAYAGREQQDASLLRAVEAKKAFLREAFGARIFDLSLAPFEISSSEIRDAVAKGQDVSAYLTPEVEHYIKEHRLYL